MFLVSAGFLEHVTVLIGIAVKGVATAGIINQPFYDYEASPKYGRSRCIWGIKGLGRYSVCLLQEIKQQERTKNKLKQTSKIDDRCLPF